MFVGNELEGGPANVYLRRHAAASIEWIPLLGPASPTRFSPGPDGTTLLGHGRWGDIDYLIELTLAAAAPTWFWRVKLENRGAIPQVLDLTYTQDVALASYGGVRLNEFYVSQYLDHSALSHPTQGLVIASRQNLAIDGRNPWSLIGSLRHGASYATDALQFYGLAYRGGVAPAGLTADLPSTRLQHEHSLAVLRDTVIRLEPGATTDAGFFGRFLEHHPEASSQADLDQVAAVLAMPEATALQMPQPARSNQDPGNPQTLFSAAATLPVRDLSVTELQSLFAGPWRHAGGRHVGRDPVILSWRSAPRRAAREGASRAAAPRPPAALRPPHHPR